MSIKNYRLTDCRSWTDSDIVAQYKDVQDLVQKINKVLVDFRCEAQRSQTSLHEELPTLNSKSPTVEHADYWAQISLIRLVEAQVFNDIQRALELVKNRYHSLLMTAYTNHDKAANAYRDFLKKSVQENKDEHAQSQQDAKVEPNQPEQAAGESRKEKTEGISHVSGVSKFED